jgi:hypothetical protein
MERRFDVMGLVKTFAELQKVELSQDTFDGHAGA